MRVRSASRRKRLLEVEDVVGIVSCLDLQKPLVVLAVARVPRVREIRIGEVSAPHAPRSTSPAASPKRSGTCSPADNPSLRKAPPTLCVPKTRFPCKSAHSPVAIGVLATGDSWAAADCCIDRRCSSDSSARRVRKFGRGRFAGESCRSPGGAASGSGGRRHAGDGRSTLLPMVLSGRRDPPNGVALEDLSIGSTEDFISDGRGERTSPSPVTQTALRNHWLTLTPPLESLSFIRRYAKLRPRYGRPRVQDFPGNPQRPSLRTLRGRKSRFAPIPDLSRSPVGGVEVSQPFRLGSGRRVQKFAR
jgi:hypothetical protein